MDYGTKRRTVTFLIEYDADRDIPVEEWIERGIDQACANASADRIGPITFGKPVTA